MGETDFSLSWIVDIFHILSHSFWQMFGVLATKIVVISHCKFLVSLDVQLFCDHETFWEYLVEDSDPLECNSSLCRIIFFFPSFSSIFQSSKSLHIPLGPSLEVPFWLRWLFLSPMNIGTSSSFCGKYLLCHTILGAWLADFHWVG